MISDFLIIVRSIYRKGQINKCSPCPGGFGQGMKIISRFSDVGNSCEPPFTSGPTAIELSQGVRKEHQHLNNSQNGIVFMQIGSNIMQGWPPIS